MNRRQRRATSPPPPADDKEAVRRIVEAIVAGQITSYCVAHSDLVPRRGNRRVAFEHGLRKRIVGDLTSPDALRRLRAVWSE